MQKLNRLYNKYGNIVDFDHYIPDRVFENYYGFTTNFDVGLYGFE